MSTKRIGDQGEEQAVGYLQQLGYRVLERQYRFQRSEIDIICLDPTQPGHPEELVFVEVKTRRGLGFGRPEDAVSKTKQRHLGRAAEAYLAQNYYRNILCRFDVIAVLFGGKQTRIEHFKDAFML